MLYLKLYTSKKISNNIFIHFDNHRITENGKKAQGLGRLKTDLQPLHITSDVRKEKSQFITTLMEVVICAPTAPGH